MFLEKFTDIEKEVFLKQFIFFAVQKERVVEEKRVYKPIDIEEKNIPFARSMMHEGGSPVLELPQIQRRFPQTETRYLMPPKQHRIAASMPFESSMMQEERFSADISEKIPEKKQIIGERRLVMPEDEIAVPIPKRLEGKKEPVTLKLGEIASFGPNPENKQEIPETLLKISAFINDTSINNIEVSSGENIKISRGNDKISTNVILSDSEVKKAIEEFSKMTKIPLSEFFKAQYGDWQINAISSEIISPRFMLTREKEFPKLGIQKYGAFEQSLQIEQSNEIISESKAAEEKIKPVETREMSQEQKIKIENKPEVKQELRPEKVKKRLFQHLPETDEIPLPS